MYTQKAFKIKASQRSEKDKRGISYNTSDFINQGHHQFEDGEIYLIEYSDYSMAKFRVCRNGKTLYSGQKHNLKKIPKVGSPVVHDIIGVFKFKKEEISK